MKRVLSIIVFVCLLVGMLPVDVFAAEGTVLTNSISPSSTEFDSSGIGDITVRMCRNSKLLAVKNGTASLNNYDYSISGDMVTIKKSYLTYYFTKFNLPGVKLNLTFDFESGVDPVLTVTPAKISNIVTCNDTVFDLSNPKDITFNVSQLPGSYYGYLRDVKNGYASLKYYYDYDYIGEGSTITIKKNYLTYFFTKFNAPWQKLNLVFDYSRGNDPMITISQIPVTNFITCENPAFDMSNPQDIKINISGNTLTAIKNGSAPLSSNDYSISGNTVTINKSYLTYFFTRFNDPWQQLNLTFDFEKGNDPLFTTKNSNISSSFIGMVKDVRIEGQSVAVIRDVNGVSTYTDFSVKVDSSDLKTGSTTATTSAGAVNAPITWNNFVTNDMQGIAGDKASITDPQHRIYKFYTNIDNKITKIERMNFGSNITPTRFNGSIDTSNGSTDIYGAIFFDLKDNKVRYWKDIEGMSTSKVVLQASMKGMNADAVAFVNGSYEYIYSTLYAYIKEEGYSDPYYIFTTGIGDALKVHKDDINQFKQIDTHFISYTKDSYSSKIRTVTKAVYNSGYVEPLVVQNDTTNSTTTVYTAYGTFGSKDGNTINIYAQGGTDSNGNTLTSGTMYSFKVDPQVTVAKLTYKDTGDIDTGSIQDAIDICKGDKVGLVIIDGSVRMIYYKR